MDKKENKNTDTKTYNSVNKVLLARKLSGIVLILLRVNLLKEKGLE